MQAKRVWLVVMLLFVSVGLVVTAHGDPSICTDKADYAPEETVHISGSGFDARASLTIKVTRPDGSVVTGDGSFAPWPTAYDSVAADGQGDFGYDYVLDGIEGEYMVEAMVNGEVLARCAFADDYIRKMIWVEKFEDKNGNGVQDYICEGPLSGWEFKLYKLTVLYEYPDWRWDCVGTAVSDSNGYADFGMQLVGLHLKCVETAKPGWTCTTGATREFSFISDTAIMFGNQWTGVPPTIACPGDITKGNDSGQCSAVVTWSAPTVIGDPTPSVGCNPASGSTFSVGTTTVTCTATNTCGTDTCSFNVTVNDTEAPVISGCASDITQDNDAGICGAAVSWTAPTAADNCGIATFTSDHASGETFPVGTTTVTYTATDIHRNSSTCSFDVTVNDNEDPVITCPGDQARSTDPGVCNYTAVGTEFDPVSFSDNCPGATISNDYNASSTLAGAVFPKGKTTVKWTVTDTSANTASCSFDVTVLDVEPPTTVLTVTPPNPDNVATPGFTWAGTDANGCTASVDLLYSYQIDGGVWSGWSVSSSATLGPLAEGDHTFNVRAKDEAGNIGAPASYTWLLDLTPPLITIITPEDRADYGLNAVVLANWGVTDALSGLASAAGTVPSGTAIDTTTQGFHDFTVTATDLAGNASTVTVTYRVVYTVNPGGAAGGGGGAEGKGGTFLDKSIAGGGGAVGITTLEAVYTVGDIIHATFSLTDVDGNNIPDAVVSCTLVKVTLGEEEAYDVLNLWGFNYDDGTELYSLDIPTEGLAPGIYDLWLGFDDGTQTRLRIQLVAGES